VPPTGFIGCLFRKNAEQFCDRLIDLVLVQARDVFDLHHLSQYAAGEREAPPVLVTQAIEQLSATR
jgi:hypothetical protein